jgi:monoamine oxidase
LLWEDLSGSLQDLHEIKGGTDSLPWSFYPHLVDDILFDAKMTEIRQDTTSVTVSYTSSLDRMKKIQCDYAILAIPFPMLHHIEGLRDFSPMKWAAITGLNYDQCGKILLQCRERFWEKEGIFGGGSESDVGIRSTWYPQHMNEFRGPGRRGILLASYTWARDTLNWSHLSVEDQVQQAAEDLESLHPQIKGKDLIEGGTSVMWHQMENFGGGFALFNPGQERLYYEVIKRPEGRIHFAGEHTSRDHRWIEGAVESGIRTATEIAGRSSAL